MEHRRPRCRRGAGITDEYERAAEHAADALRNAPGARGLIHLVTPAFSRIGYVYVRLLSRGFHDPDTGAVVWEPAGRCDSNPPGGLPADGSDGMPPEAIAAGRHDLEAEQARRRALGLPVLPPMPSALAQP